MAFPFERFPQASFLYNREGQIFAALPWAEVEYNMQDHRQGVIEPRAHELAPLLVVPSNDFPDLFSVLGATLPQSGVDRVASFLFQRLTRDPNDSLTLYLPTSDAIHRLHHEVMENSRGQLVMPVVITYRDGRTLEGGFTITYTRNTRHQGGVINGQSAYDITVSIDT